MGNGTLLERDDLPRKRRLRLAGQEGHQGTRPGFHDRHEPHEAVRRQGRCRLQRLRAPRVPGPRHHTHRMVHQPARHHQAKSVLRVPASQASGNRRLGGACHRSRKHLADRP